MPELRIVDCTFRDAHQSSWGEKMSTAMMCKMAPWMRDAGFHAMDVMAISHFEFAVRHFRENPWDRLRLLSRALPRTPLSLMMLGNSLTLFGITRGPILGLWMERLAANGMRRVQLMDQLNTMTSMTEGIRYAHEAGLQVMASLIYSLSPVHTDEHFAAKARETVALGVDGIYLKDPGGLLTPERTRTIIPAIRENIGELPFEFHSHCTTGLAPLCYLEAMKLGVTTYHTASRPLANGSSLPSTENTIRNAQHLGFSSSIDLRALEAVSGLLRRIAEREGFPVGTPLEHDLSQYEHQVPGGVISNLRRQLSEIGVEDKLDAVLGETVLVRKELGYPIMVTPLSQFVVTQATLNVVSGERYKTVTDDVVKYALGFYGEPVVPIEPNVRDRIMSQRAAKELANWQPYAPPLAELRRRHGQDCSDEDLLLRVLCKGDDVEAMHAAGPIQTEYPDDDGSVVHLVRDFAKQKRTAYLHVKKPDFSLTLRKEPGGVPSANA